MKKSLGNSAGAGAGTEANLRFTWLDCHRKMLVGVLAVFLLALSFESVAVAQLRGSAGNVRVNIQWTGGNVDLDLYVTDPCGNVLGYAERTNAQCEGFQGEWDFDDTGDARGGDENIVWADGAPIGRYSVHVNYFLGFEVADYTIRIFYGDQEQIHRGEIGPADEGRRHVTDFDADESVNFPIASFALSSTSVEEGSGTHNIAVNLSPAPRSDFTLIYTYGGGTAMPGDDYSITGVTVDVSAGASTVNIPVVITEDNVVEGSEVIVLSLTDGMGYTVGSPNDHVLTIADNDMRGVALSTNTLNVVEGQSGAYSIGLTSRPDVDDEIIVTPRSNNPHVNFTPTSLTFNAETGNAPQQVSFVVTADNQDDTLTISHDVSGYGDLTDGGTVTVNIVQLSVASLALPSSSVDESSGAHNVTVNLSPAPQSNVTLSYTLTGTAMPGDDYSITGVTGQTGTVEASVGSSTVDIMVSITDDNAVEGNETILLTLTDGVGYTVGSANAHTVTIADNDTRGVELSTSTLSTVEGQHGTYSIGLTSRLDVDDDVIVTPRSDNPHVSFTPRSLTFNAETGNAPQQVSFVVTADNQDDTLTISHDVSGYGDLTDGGTVTVNVIPSSTVSEPEEKALVKDTVKAVAASAVANVSANIGARFSGSPGGAAPALTLAGVPVDAGVDWWSGEEVRLQRRGAPDLWDEAEGRPRVWSPSMTDLLRGSAFQVALGAAESGAGIGGIFSGVTMWGRGDMVRLESDAEKEGSYDGRILAGYLGLDKRVTNQWTLGVAASRIGVSADYALESGKGELELNLTGVHPYARFASAQGTELSVILGWSAGEIENVREGAVEREATDTRLFMAGVGGRQKVASGILGGMDVALLGDVGYGQVSGESDETLETLDDLMIDTLRVRGGVEGSYTKELETGATLTPFVELAGRYDGGSGDDSSGMEVAGGVTYAAPAQGLGLQARAYALVLSSRSDYREYGASATVSLTSRQRGQGLSVSVTPRLGRPSGGADALWRTDPFAFSGQPQEPEFALDARVEYGVAGLAFGGTVTPFTELQWLGDDRRRVRAGVRIGRKAQAGRGLDVRFYSERTMHVRDGAEDRINLLANWRF